MKLKPSYSIQIGSLKISTAKANRLLLLCIDRSINTPVSQAIIRLPNIASDGVQRMEEVIQTGDNCMISLGYTGDEKLVFTGKVASIYYFPSDIEIRVESCFTQLVSQKVNFTFDKMMVSTMIKEVAQTLDIPIGNIDPGPRLDFYAMGDHQTAYEHLKKLAAWSRHCFYASLKDQLVYQIDRPGPVLQLVYGKHILKLSTESFKNTWSTTAVYGSSPASLGSGPKASSWLTKKSILGRAGIDKGNTLTVFEPAIKSLNLANQTANTLLKNRKVNTGVKVDIPGYNSVDLTDTVQLKKSPNKTSNDSYRVESIQHRLDVRNGFTTTLKMMAN